MIERGAKVDDGLECGGVHAYIDAKENKTYGKKIACFNAS